MSCVRNEEQLRKVYGDAPVDSAPKKPEPEPIDDDELTSLERMVAAGTTISDETWKRVLFTLRSERDAAISYRYNAEALFELNGSIACGFAFDVGRERRINIASFSAESVRAAFEKEGGRGFRAAVLCRGGGTARVRVEVVEKKTFDADVLARFETVEVKPPAHGYDANGSPVEEASKRLDEQPWDPGNPDRKAPPEPVLIAKKHDTPFEQLAHSITVYGTQDYVEAVIQFAVKLKAELRASELGERPAGTEDSSSPLFSRHVEALGLLRDVVESAKRNPSELYKAIIERDDLEHITAFLGPSG